MEENDVGKRWAGALSQVEGLGLPLGWAELCECEGVLRPTRDKEEVVG